MNNQLKWKLYTEKILLFIYFIRLLPYCVITIQIYKDYITIQILSNFFWNGHYSLLQFALFCVRLLTCHQNINCSVQAVTYVWREDTGYQQDGLGLCDELPSCLLIRKLLLCFHPLIFLKLQLAVSYNLLRGQE